jgi:hypothetical protein
MNPNTKMFHNGKEINWKNQYKKISWFTRAQRWTIKWTKRVVFTAFVIGMLYGVFTAGSMSTTAQIVMAEDTSVEKYANKIETLKAGVVEQLMSCEGAGYKEDDGIIIFDTNNKASIGLAQFQISTVQHYYKTLYGKTITRKEAVLIALDKQKAKELAQDVMFKTKNKASGDWYNCEKKLNLDAQIDVIKKLE